MDPEIERLKERAWREVGAIDEAFRAGRLDEAGWHRAMAGLVGPAYLSAGNAYGQAGHTGDAASWNASRGIIAHALHRSGTFLDAGCASGILMESVAAWGRRKRLVIEPFGLEIVPELAALARSRLQDWAERISEGNVRSWRAGRRFDYVLIRPEYAPPGKRGDMAGHVLRELLAPRGRLIVFVGSEESGRRIAEADLAGRGLVPHGRVERPHPGHAGLRRRLFWIDAHRVN